MTPWCSSHSSLIRLPGLLARICCSRSSIASFLAYMAMLMSDHQLIYTSVLHKTCRFLWSHQQPSDVGHTVRLQGQLPSVQHFSGALKAYIRLQKLWAACTADAELSEHSTVAGLKYALTTYF